MPEVMAYLGERLLVHDITGVAIHLTEDGATANMNKRVSVNILSGFANNKTCESNAPME